jgi:hypothetical protein
MNKDPPGSVDKRRRYRFKENESRLPISDSPDIVKFADIVNHLELSGSAN